MPPTAGQRGPILRFLFPGLSRNLGRNAIDLFNRGHVSFTRMFHDSRVRVAPNHPGGFATPAGAELPPGLDSVLAAQALFPLVSPDEMLGLPGENRIARLSTDTAIWRAFTDRVLAIGTYRRMLMDAYPLVPVEHLGIQHIANAIAAFQEVIWRADDSPFDRFLRGDDHAMDGAALQGAQLFYGKARCGTCHTGSLQTDNEHYAVAMPQFGRGQGDGIRGLEDFGLGRITGRVEDRYKFRTPSLRNVALTGPWGHDGAYADLRAVVAHFANPQAAFQNWRPSQAQLVNIKYPKGFFDAYFDQAIGARLLAANELPPTPLTGAELNRLTDFLYALTDTSFDARDGVPAHVPSGQRDIVSQLPDIIYSGDEGLRIGHLRLRHPDRPLFDNPFLRDLLGL